MHDYCHCCKLPFQEQELISSKSVTWNTMDTMYIFPEYMADLLEQWRSSSLLHFQYKGNKPQRSHEVSNSTVNKLSTALCFTGFVHVEDIVEHIVEMVCLYILVLSCRVEYNHCLFCASV